MTSKECIYCKENFLDDLVQCTGCGKPYDPSGARLDWDRMTGWERCRYIEILEWEQRRYGGGWPTSVTDRISAAMEWSAELAPEIAKKAILEALEKGLGCIRDASQMSIRRDSVLKDMREGLGISSWEDVRTANLDGIDKLVTAYSDNHKILAMCEGAGAGFGGLVFAAADIPALMGICLRLLAQFSYLHGRDPQHENEQDFMLRTLQFGGGAEDQAIKVALMKEFNDIMIAAARDWTWRRLNKSMIVKMIQKVCQYLGVTLTKRKLLQIIPVLGSAVGAGVNYGFLADVARCGRNVYGKRFLYDKYFVSNRGGRV